MANRSCNKNGLVLQYVRPDETSSRLRSGEHRESGANESGLFSSATCLAVCNDCRAKSLWKFFMTVCKRR